MSDKVQAGDVVSIRQHTRAPKLYPDSHYTEEASEGWVVTGRSPLTSPRERCFTLEKLPTADTGWSDNEYRFIEECYLTVTRKGSGSFTRGVDLPLNGLQQRKMRFEKFRVRVASAIIERGPHEGWSNPATWHVNLCLTNNQHFMHVTLPSLWRADGSLNPNKLEKAWSWLCARSEAFCVEDWMYAAPIEVPGEFARWSLPELQALRIDWSELAAELSRKPAAMRA